MSAFIHVLLWICSVFVVIAALATLAALLSELYIRRVESSILLSLYASGPQGGKELSSEKYVSRSSVYVLLARLESRGLVSSEYELSTYTLGGHKRRVYRLTEEGEEKVKDICANYSIF